MIQVKRAMLSNILLYEDTNTHKVVHSINFSGCGHWMMLFFFLFNDSGHLFLEQFGKVVSVKRQRHKTHKKWQTQNVTLAISQVSWQFDKEDSHTQVCIRITHGCVYIYVNYVLHW